MTGEGAVKLERKIKGNRGIILVNINSLWYKCIVCGDHVSIFTPGGQCFCQNCFKGQNELGGCDVCLQNKDLECVDRMMQLCGLHYSQWRCLNG